MGQAVQNLWTNREFPVERVTADFFFATDVSEKTRDPSCARIFVARFACARRCNA
jgi:hypothetical protein